MKTQITTMQHSAQGQRSALVVVFWCLLTGLVWLMLPGVAAAQTVETFTSPGSSSWTAPANVYEVIVECWGGGGSGAGDGGNDNVAPAGGGGGAYARSLVSVTPGVSYSYTVGSGGAGASNSNGVAGGSSTFDSTVCIANGGGGGTGAAGGAGTPGAGGTATGNIAAYSGGSGSTGSGNVGGGGGSGGGALDPDGSGEELSFSPTQFAATATGNPDAGWTSAANAFSSDNLYATTTVSDATQSYSEFGFSIPLTNTITGIIVRLEASASSSGGTIAVTLSWDGGTSVTEAKVTDVLTTTDTIYTLGGVGDLWGRTWAVTELSDEQFRLQVVGQPDGNTLRLDALQVEPLHQSSGGGGGGGGRL